MRRGYQNRRQYERSLYRQPYLAQSVANTKAAQERESERVCGTCREYLPHGLHGICNQTGEILASVWSRPCWQGPGKQTSAHDDKCGGNDTSAAESTVRDSRTVPKRNKEV